MGARSCREGAHVSPILPHPAGPLQFERNRYIRNPRELARVLEAAEERLKDIAHPDPYKRECLHRLSITQADLPVHLRRGHDTDSLSISHAPDLSPSPSLALCRSFTPILVLRASASPAPMGEDGTKWERNIPPRMFTEAEKREAIDNQHF